MRLLLHICCAPCLVKCLQGLREEFGDALDVTGFWYNPNIHPLLEYRRREKSLRVYLERDPLPCLFSGNYALAEFCDAVHGAYTRPDRCNVCYRLRMQATAQAARDNSFDAFGTTMMTSLHQDHAQIRTQAQAAADAQGLTFVYRDLRNVEVPEASYKGLYKQQYCGCVFSEEERFAGTGKHLYRAGNTTHDE